jgi:hypothetical protein
MILLPQNKRVPFEVLSYLHLLSCLDYSYVLPCLAHYVTRFLVELLNAVSVFLVERARVNASGHLKVYFNL